MNIDPLWVGAVTTRGQALDQEVAEGFRAEQRKAKEISEIRARLERTPEKKLKLGRLTFKLIGDVVYAVDRKRRQRFVVPRSLVQKVLEREHTVGHLGVDKMYSGMSRKYYWKNMFPEITKFVQECYVCQVCKRNFKHTMVPLKELPRPEKVQDVCALDVKGPLPVSHGKKYILVCVDLFSRYAFTRSVGHVDGKAVINFLVEEVFRFGVCRTVITDNAKNLKEGVAGFMYEKLGTENRNSIPFFASSNGGVERLIGTLASMLRCASVEDPRNWAQWVPELTTEYNHSVHRATGVSPFHLHFGYEPRRLGEVPEASEGGRNLTEPQRYLEETRKRREKISKAVKRGLEDYYDEMAKDYDHSHKVKSHGFKVGDWVLVMNKARAGDGKALGPLYIGPAEITKVTDTSAKVVFLSNGAE